MRNQRGQVLLIELALILPVLLIMTYAIVDLGRYLYIRNTLTNVAAVGARQAAITPQLSAIAVSDLFTAPPNQEPARSMQQAVSGMSTNNINYRVDLWDTANAVVPGPAQSGFRVAVTVSYNYQLLTPFFKMLGVSNSGFGSLPITYQASVRYE